MQGLKGVIVVATIVAAAVALGGCFHHEQAVTHEPLKLGSADIVVEQVVRVEPTRAHEICPRRGVTFRGDLDAGTPKQDAAASQASFPFLGDSSPESLSSSR